MEYTGTPLLSIVIPLYNEARRVCKSFAALARFADARLVPSYEVIFVDDGSRDATRALVEEFIATHPSARLVSHKKNCGKGAAVRTGMLAARGAWRLFADADMATDLLEFRGFLPPLAAGAPVVIGSRRTAGASVRVHQPRLREALGGVYTFLANLFTGASVSDFTCGFKCFSAEAAKAIFARAKIARWSYDAEILFLARLLGFPIKEVPVSWANDGATRVRLWRDAPRSLVDLFVIRLLAAAGKYNEDRVLGAPRKQEAAQAVLGDDADRKAR